ncbi:hypothetical protein COCOBI_09-0400 [Coccomyxa sp. Obi]|nr:hypothetical protein COCOBI_09-0400 [Coccomyxa sp. Obi]
MGSTSSKEAREETRSLEQKTLAPALDQADGKTDQRKGNAGDQSEVHNETNEKPSVFLSEDIWEKVSLKMTTVE